MTFIATTSAERALAAMARVAELETAVGSEMVH